MGPAPVLSFVQVAFNDLEPADAFWQRLPPEVRKKVPAPTLNRVAVTSRYYAEGRPLPLLNSATTFAEPALFKPSGYSGKPGDWRRIRIEVSMKRIRVYWQNLLVGNLNSAEIDNHDRASIVQERKEKPNNPALTGLNPVLNSRGKIGLYLYLSYASFKNVRIKPIPDTDTPRE
jgi:hypothetical protein